MNNKMILLEKDGGIAWLQLNRPDKLNALNPAVFSALDLALDDCEADDEIRVVVITGNEKAFAAGADIEHMSRGHITDSYRFTGKVIPIQEKLADFPKPTIAAISGYALGGGLELSLCCDFRIATDTAVIGLPEISLGIIPGGGGTQRLPRLINYSAAAEMIMLGEMIKADKALALGILNRVVPVDRLEEEILGFSKKIMSRPAVALRAAKIAMRKGLNMSLKDGLQVEQDLFCMLFGTEDQKEGMAAFLQKRKAAFKGR
jgi:enoyl-CoA hydratase/carnithine racemase